MFKIENIKIDKVTNLLSAKAEKKISNLAMPLGSLGNLHSLAKKIVNITNNLNPPLKSCTIFIYAGDHGITKQGVSAYTHKITYYNVLNMLQGKSTINAFSDSTGTNLIIIDIGIASQIIIPEKINSNLKFYNSRVANGTKDCMHEAAMSIDDVLQGIYSGYKITNENIDNIDAIGIGEMGIGNTSIASLISSILLGIPIEDITGPGSGLNPKGLSHKIDILKKVLYRIKSLPKNNVISLLSEVGGHELNGMIGSIICACEHHKPVLVDGFIASTAALSATFINPNIKDYLIFCTQSTEPGHRFIYEYFGQVPILSLGLRLGEGTGASLAWPILKASIKQFSDIADLSDISIEKPNPEGYIAEW